MGTHKPVIHISLYRKIATCFAVATALLLVLILYVAFARATITVTPRKTPVESEVLVAVRANPFEGEVRGVLEETTIEKKKTLPITGTGRTEEGKAEGVVTLINLTSRDQPLVATTRVLSDGAILFRLKKSTLVPAGGRVDAEVHADVPGTSGDIGPSKFTIPGLNSTLQQSIYAVSTEAMTGGTRTIKVVSDADVTNAIKTVEEELLEEAKVTLLALAGDAAQGGGVVYSHEVTKQETSAAVGTEASSIEVAVAIKVMGVFYDRSALETISTSRLRVGVPTGQELVSSDPSAYQVSIERTDPQSQSATVKVLTSGLAAVDASSDIFDRDKLAGKTANAVEQYFKQFPEIESVSVRFRPSWLRRVPNPKDHIDIVIIR